MPSVSNSNCRSSAKRTTARSIQTVRVLLQTLKRSKGDRKQERHADRRTERDRPLLVRKFALRLEPDCTRSIGGTAIRRVGERPAVSAGESRDGRRLHRRLRKQILLQLLAAGHCHSRAWRQRMAKLPADPAGTGLPLDPYGRRRCRSYGDGPVLQHRLHQFLDDERRTLSGHHPQVLELL